MKEELWGVARRIQPTRGSRVKRRAVDARDKA